MAFPRNVSPAFVLTESTAALLLYVHPDQFHSHPEVHGGHTVDSVQSGLQQEALDLTGLLHFVEAVCGNELPEDTTPIFKENKSFPSRIT